MYERGEREPGLEMLETIADFFNVDMDYLAFLINSFPWRIMLGNGLKVIEGIYTPTSLGGLKKLPVIILSKEEQEACAFLNTFITAMYDDMGKDGRFY